MRITFLGHSGFLLKGETKVAIDPFITGNPVYNTSLEELKPDLILVTHGHGDHLGDAVQISKKTSATIVSVYEVATYCTRFGATAHPMHIGGSRKFDKVKVKLTPAWHGSGLITDGPAEYLGTPCGFILTMDGKTIYHSGDTALFGDMELIGRLNTLDLALLPIGDNFTMGPEDALEAVKMLKPKMVIPMHYNTWPIIEQNPEQFKTDVERNTPATVMILKPGETYEI